jgi:KDO2-lipid IV(A) lauroyltransferase
VRRLIQTLLFQVIKALLHISSWIPLPIIHILGRVLGWVLASTPNRARSTTRTNLRLCFPYKSESQINELSLRSLQNTSCTALEMGKAWVAPIEAILQLVTETQGLEQLQRDIKSGNGVILLAPHLSNWEVFGPVVASHGIKSTFLYKPPKIEVIDRLLKATRSRNNINLAPANRAGVAVLLKALKAGELVGILPDQVPELGGGEYANFFNQPALTMVLASRLIQRTNARVYCGFAKRLPGGNGFKMIIMPADEKVYEDDLARSVQGVSDSVQKCVEMAVDQYQWEYKRFRRQPDGREFYRNRSK